MTSPFGEGEYAVQVVGRGGSPVRIELPNTGFSYSYTLDGISRSQVNIPFGKCKGAFKDSVIWRDEILIYRDAKDMWSGPLLTKNASGGRVFGAADHMKWMDKRFIDDDLHFEGDLAYVFKEVWNYGYDKDPFGVELSVRDTGIHALRDFGSDDLIRAGNVLQELGRTGIDWYMHGGDRKLYAGPPSYFHSPLPLVLHDDGVASVDIEEDGEQFFTDVAVFSGSNRVGEGAIVGRATRATSIYGLIQESFTELLIKDTPSADNNALGRLEAVHPLPRIVNVTLSSKAGFTFDHLHPGVVIDVRLTEDVADVEIEEDMKVQEIEVQVSGGQETVRVSLVPLGLEDEA